MGVGDRRNNRCYLRCNCHSYSFLEALRLFLFFRLDFPSFISSCGLGGISRSRLTVRSNFVVSEFVMSKRSQNSTSFVEGLAEFLPPFRNKEAFFAALGKLIAEYAQAEMALHMLARKLSGMPDDKARIVFAGMRLSDLSDRLRGLMRCNKTDAPTFNDVDACLKQLDLVSTQRNNLVHRWVTYAEERMRVTNALTAKTTAGIEVHKLDIDDFENMTLDCLAMTARLHGITTDGWKAKQSPTMIENLYLPWRYKPVPPKTQTKQPPSAPPKP
jgi:hypothetical protein